MPKPHPVDPKSGRPYLHPEQEIFNWVYDPVNNALRTYSTGGTVEGGSGGSCDLNVNISFAEILAKLDEVIVAVGASDDATVAKLEQIRALLETSSANLVTLVTDVAKDATLITMKSVLDDISTEAKLHPHIYVSGEGTTGTDIDTSGVTVTVPFYRSVNINRVYVRQLVGSATKATVTVYRKLVPTGDIDIVYYNDDYKTSTKIDDIVGRYYFHNPDNLDEIYINIKPNNGTSNQYFYFIDGLKLV